jgi:hypothetical protein
MSAQINNHSNIITKGDRPMDSNKILTILKENPIKLLLIFCLFGGAATYIVLTTTHTPTTTAYYATTYHCETRYVWDIPFCYKIQDNPPDVTIVSYFSECPNNPPTYCP